MKIKQHLIVVLCLGWLSLSLQTRASCTNGCLSNDNTALGDNALSSNSGLSNTAVGSEALTANSGGSYNVAIGAGALQTASVGSKNVAIGYEALYNGDDSMGNTAHDNTATGYQAGLWLYGTTGSYNTAYGSSALSNIDGEYNTATGYFAMGGQNGFIGGATQNTATGAFSLQNDLTGINNTATGFQAMEGSNASFGSSGSNNTATGYASLFSYTSGSNNTASGYQALFSDTTGGSNTASGYDALYFNTMGNYNTALGRGALYSNGIGGSNTASGYDALHFNASGNFNTAIGRGALYKNTSSNNVAVGYQALNQNSNGIYNTAVGTQALAAVTSNSANTAIGYVALNKSTGSGSTAIGENALDNATTGGANIAIGAAAGANVTTGSSNIDIGNLGAAESNTIRIGTIGPQANTYIAGISGVTVAGGIGVIMDSSGHLGTSTSSARYKENIQPMDKASEAILALKPVTFRYKHELDPKAIPQFGLVAEQVDKVDPDLVARDDHGKPYSVRYEAVNAMLLNEFLKAHRKLSEQAEKAEEQTKALRTYQSEIARLESDLAEQRKDFEGLIAQQQKQIGALTVGVQKVSARLESSAPPAQVVANN